jgi:hypothetical protein
LQVLNRGAQAAARGAVAAGEEQLGRFSVEQSKYYLIIYTLAR